MADDNAPIGDATEQVKEIFESLTAVQMVQNDIDTATTAREFRKIAHGAAHMACPLLSGVSGLTQDEKIEALQTARDLMALSVEALNKAIDLAVEKQKESTK